jgi:hypothetical protein
MSGAERNDERGAVAEQLKALGYIDPGAGSSLWQLVLARIFRMTAGFRKLFGGAQSDEE